MSNMLMPHWIPYHRGSFDEFTDASVFKDMGATCVKIVTSGPGVLYPEDVPPGAKIMHRNHPLSEDGPRSRGALAASPEDLFARRYTGMAAMMLRENQFLLPAALIAHGDPISEAALTAAPTSEDPIALARKHCLSHLQTAQAYEAIGIHRSRLLLPGLNEPNLWSTEPPEWFALYELERLKGNQKNGIPTVVGEFGIGWPGNGGVKDAPVDIAFMAPVAKQMGPNDVMSYHGYWALNGWRENLKWWAGRFVQWPFDVNIMITEAGIDTGVTGQWYGGWQDLPEHTMDLKAERYVDEQVEYAKWCAQDKRVIGVFTFTHDMASQHWQKFNVRSRVFYVPFLKRTAEAQVPVRPTTPQPPVTPEVPVPTTDAFVAFMQRELGKKFSDIRASLPHTGEYAHRDPGKISHIVIHHSVTPENTPWVNIARYHIQKVPANPTDPKDPAIAYHIGVQSDGQILYLGDVATHRWHAGAGNTNSIGVCCLGNYETSQPSAKMIASLRELIQALNKLSGKQLKVEGHKQFMQTACPGKNLMTALAIAQPTVPVPVPLPPTASILAAAYEHAGLLYQPTDALYVAGQAAKLGFPLSGAYEKNGRVQMNFALGVAYYLSTDPKNIQIVRLT